MSLGSTRLELGCRTHAQKAPSKIHHCFTTMERGRPTCLYRSDQRAAVPRRRALHPMRPPCDLLLAAAGEAGLLLLRLAALAAPAACAGCSGCCASSKMSIGCIIGTIALALERSARDAAAFFGGLRNADIDSRRSRAVDLFCDESRNLRLVFGKNVVWQECRFLRILLKT